MRGGGALYLVVAVAAGAVYLNSLGGDFVWDDRKLIVEDHAIKSWHHLDDIFSHDFFARHEDDRPYGYYRPVTTLTYLADYAVWGLRPAGYHLTNVLLHAANSILVVSLLLALGWSPLAGGIAGLLFAVHPIHSENVAWIAGRTDLVAFLFSALALRLHLAATHDGARHRTILTLAVTAFALGLLAKEMSIVLVGWIAAVHAIAYRQPTRTALRATTPYLAVLAAYVLSRFALLDVAVPGVPAEHSAGAVALTAAPTIVRYLAWLALPLAQSAYVLNPYVQSLADPRLWLAVAVLGGLVAAHRRYVGELPRVALAAAMLAISFLPLLNVVRVAGPADMGDVMAERFLYFPSFPFVALVGLGVAALLERALPRRSSARWAVVAVPLALLALATAIRNRVWRDELTFFSATVAQSPRSALLWSSLATYHLRTGDLGAADTAINRAAETEPDSYAVRSSRALWFVLSERSAEAIPLQETIVHAARRGRTPALNNLAYLYRTTGREAEAREILERLVAEDRASADVYFNLAEIYRHAEVERARDAYRLALADRPQDLDIATALAQLEMDQGRPDEAERVYRGLLRSYPDDAGLLNNVALTRYQLGDTAGALDLLRRAIAAEPDYVRARINYAQILQAAGRPADALAAMVTAARLAAGTDLESLAAEQLATMRGARPLSGEVGSDR